MVMTRKAKDRDDWSGLPDRPLSPAEMFGFYNKQHKEFQRQPRWGGWRFDKQRLVLTNTECASYEIDVGPAEAPKKCSTGWPTLRAGIRTRSWDTSSLRWTTCWVSGKTSSNEDTATQRRSLTYADT